MTSTESPESRRRAYWWLMEAVVWGGSDSKHWCRECGGRYPMHATQDCKALRFERAAADYVKFFEDEVAALQARAEAAARVAGHAHGQIAFLLSCIASGERLNAVDELNARDVLKELAALLSPPSTPPDHIEESLGGRS